MKPAGGFEVSPGLEGNRTSQWDESSLPAQLKSAGIPVVVGSRRRKGISESSREKYCGSSVPHPGDIRGYSWAAGWRDGIAGQLDLCADILPEAA
jgi:hypothetical protein